MDKPWVPPKFVDAFFRPDLLPAASVTALRAKIALLGDLPGPTQRVSAVTCAVCWGLLTMSILLAICLGRHPAGGLLPVFIFAILRVFTYVLRAIMSWSDKWHASMLTAEAMCLNGGLSLLCLGLAHLFSQAARPYRPERGGLLRILLGGPMYWFFWVAICTSAVLFVIAGHALFKMLMGDLEWTTMYRSFVRGGLQILVVTVGIHVELVATLWFLRANKAYDMTTTTHRTERTKLIFLGVITLGCAWLVTCATVTAYIGGQSNWITSASGFFAVFEPVELILVLVWVAVRWQSLLYPPPPIDEAPEPDIVDCPTPEFIVYTQQPARPSSASSVDWQKAGRVFSPGVVPQPQLITSTSPLAHTWGDADEPPRSARRRAAAAAAAASTVSAQTARDSRISDSSLRSKWSPDSPIHAERPKTSTPVSAGFVAKKLLLLGQGHGHASHALSHGHHGPGHAPGPSVPSSKRLL